MGLKSESCYLAITGLFRVLEFSTTIWYLLTQEFDSDLVYYFTMSFLFFPGLVVLLCSSASPLIHFYTEQQVKPLLKLGFNFLHATLDPPGVFLILLSAYAVKSKLSTERFEAIDSLSKTTGNLVIFGESIPQIVLQCYNSSKVNDFTLPFAFSVICSFLNIIYTCLRLIYKISVLNRETNQHVVTAVTPQSDPNSNNTKSAFS